MPPCSAVLNARHQKARSLKSRPFSGISVISLGAITSPFAEVSVFNSGTLGFDVDGLRERSDLKLSVETRRLVHLQLQILLAELLEALLLHDYLVVPGRQGGNGVFPSTCD